MIDYSQYVLFADILTYSTILPFVFSWWRFNIPTYLKPLRILFIVSFVSTYALSYFKELNGNNLFVGVTYITIEYLLFSRIYWLEIPNSAVRKTIKYSSILIGLFALINLIFIQGLTNENSYTRSLIPPMTILLTFAYFLYMLNSLKVENLYQHPMFWINCGVLLFASASFVLFLFSGYLQSTRDSGPLMTFWTFKNIIGMLRNVFFAYAFWLNFKLFRQRSHMSMN